MTPKKPALKTEKAKNGKKPLKTLLKIWGGSEVEIHLPQ